MRIEIGDVYWRDETCRDMREVCKFLDSLETWRAGISKILFDPQPDSLYPYTIIYPTEVK